jgi:osmotically-inducible protein OsmY
MKKALFLFLIGAAAGAFGYYYLQEKRAAKPVAPATTEAKPEEKSAPPAPTLSDRARDEARAVKDSVANKLSEWHLTPDEIGSELSRTGQVVRTKAQATGETIATATSNARIVTVIKAKYALDKELSARAIEVDCESGQVTLIGNVASTALVAKAVGIALDTDGVTHVTAKLKVAPEKG